MAKDTTTVDDGPEDPGDQPARANVEDRLGKLEKALTDAQRTAEDERKRAAGLDKKVTELLNEKKVLQESTLSKDKLLEIHESELKDRQAEWDAKSAAERMELQNLRVELDRRDVVSKLDGFPSFLIGRVRGTTRDEIEADARELMNHWVKDRSLVDNARKTTGRPRSGTGKQLAVTAEDVMEMTPEQQAAWAKGASKEEYDAVFSDIANMPKKNQ